ncbi:hypothetical protein [Sporosarcina obsidiansis]|nr:hypothetical protein [Sporosarcina obsidiansis]
MNMLFLFGMFLATAIAAIMMIAIHQQKKVTILRYLAK